MGLNLAPPCAARLTSALEEALPRLNLQNGVLSPASYSELLSLDSILPTHGDLHGRLLSYLGEGPASEFWLHLLTRELVEGLGRESAPLANTRLIEHPSYSNISQLAARLLAQFESLPWQYTLSFRLPSEFSEVFVPEIRDFRLSDHLRVFAPDAMREPLYPLPTSSSSLLGFSTQQRRDPTAAYIEADVQGFVAPFADTTPMRQFTDSLRSFAGLSVGLGLFSITPSFDLVPTPSTYIAHRRVGGTHLFDCECRWDTAQSHHFGRQRLNHEFNSLSTPSARAGRMRMLLNSLRPAFALDPWAEKVRLASQWFFDSLSTTDGALAFVQAIVVLEVLLGDKLASDKVGVTELLASRCAFLLAVSADQRGQLLDDFRSLYALRSHIVHRGKSNLTQNERVALARLRRLCSAVLRKEVSMLTIPNSIQQVSATPEIT